MGNNGHKKVPLPALSSEEMAEVFGSSGSKPDEAKVQLPEGHVYPPCSVTPSWYGEPKDPLLALRQQKSAVQAEKERKRKIEQERWSHARGRKYNRARLQAISDGTKPPTDMGTQLFLWLIQATVCVVLYFILAEPVRWVAIALVLFRDAMDQGFDNLNARLNAQQALAKLPPPDADELKVGPPTWRERAESVMGVLFGTALFGALIWLVVSHLKSIGDLLVWISKHLSASS